MKNFLSNLKFAFGMLMILALSVVIAYSMVTVSTTMKEQEYKDAYTSGRQYLEAADYEKAITAFEEAYLSNPTDEAAIGLAEAWFGKGDAKQAITVLANRIGLYESTDTMNELLTTYKESIGIYEKVLIGGKEIPVNDTMIYIKDVTLTEDDLQKISQFTEVVTLHLENCGISDISFLKNCNKLMSLTLTMNPISDFSVLFDKPDLRTLYINDTAITDFEQLHNLTQISTLNANGNWITVEQLHALQAALPGVELYAGHNMLIETIEFAGETFTSDCHTLDLSNHNISETSILEKCRHLMELNLADNRISWISGIDKILPLVKLNLSGNRLSNISALSTLGWMQQLNVANNSITDISVVTSMPHLTELDVSGNPLYHGHEALAGLTKLQKLNLQDSLWKDSSLQYIPMDNMQELDLRNNTQLSEAEVKHFIAQHPNCTIYHDYM